MRFLNKYKEHIDNINESNLDSDIKFYFALAEFDRGYGGLDMRFVSIGKETYEIPAPNELPDFPKIFYRNEIENYESDLYGKVYLIAIDTRNTKYFSISGHPGRIPQETDLEIMEEEGKIEFWGSSNNIEDLAECLRDMYEYKPYISYIFYYTLNSCKLGEQVISYIKNSGIISQEKMNTLESMAGLVGIGLFY